MAILDSGSQLSMCTQKKRAIWINLLSCTGTTTGCTHARWTCRSGHDSHFGQRLSIVDVHTKRISVHTLKITNLYLEGSAESYSFTIGRCFLIVDVHTMRK